MKDFLLSFLSGYTQKANRHLNPAYLELLYQSNYLQLSKSVDFLHEVPLSSPRGGTASFGMLYVLLSILKDAQVFSILEIGAGQSTCLLAQYTSSSKATATIVDHDRWWLDKTTAGHSHLEAIHSDLCEQKVSGRKIQWYDTNQPKKKYSLVIIDGPPANTRSKRFNRLGILNWIPAILEDQFVVIIDDTNRAGERLLAAELFQLLQNSAARIYRNDIIAANTTTLITSEAFRNYTFL